MKIIILILFTVAVVVAAGGCINIHVNKPAAPTPGTNAPATTNAVTGS